MRVLLSPLGAITSFLAFQQQVLGVPVSPESGSTGLDATLQRRQLPFGNWIWNGAQEIPQYDPYKANIPVVAKNVLTTVATTAEMFFNMIDWSQPWLTFYYPVAQYNPGFQPDDTVILMWYRHSSNFVPGHSAIDEGVTQNVVAAIYNRIVNDGAMYGQFWWNGDPQSGQDALLGYAVLSMRMLYPWMRNKASGQTRQLLGSTPDADYGFDNVTAVDIASMGQGHVVANDGGPQFPTGPGFR